MSPKRFTWISIVLTIEVLPTRFRPGIKKELTSPIVDRATSLQRMLPRPTSRSSSPDGVRGVRSFRILYCIPVDIGSLALNPHQ